MDEKILEAVNIIKYFSDPVKIQVLKEINFSMLIPI